MGIFDDAIRQHLDLKRLQGAEETELKQLEDEAFGPPARPGDPEFGDTGEQAAADSPDEVAAAPDAEAVLAAEPEAEAPSAIEPDAEAAPDSAFTTAEREAIAEQPTTFFDQQIGDAEPALELEDLDLDLEEELEQVGALAEAEVSEPEPEPDEPEAEAIEPEPAQSEPEPEPLEPEPAAEAEVVEPSEPEPAEEGDAAEDVLEETPEFLRDKPDDDELWFEQGKPKDFDF